MKEYTQGDAPGGLHPHLNKDSDDKILDAEPDDIFTEAPEREWICFAYGSHAVPGREVDCGCCKTCYLGFENLLH